MNVPESTTTPNPTLDSFRLTGRTAVVTGGNRGLGRAFALALADVGADVAVLARDTERSQEVVREIEKRGVRGLAVPADLTAKADVQRAVSTVLDAFGAIDVLVNNAGVCHHAPAFEVTDENWQSVFDLNVTAVWWCATEVARHMAGRGRGSIVNIGSMSGIVVNRPQMQPAYNASKAAVHQLTRSLAVEWASRGIRVNAVAPGYVKTEMSPVDRPEFRRYWIEDTPMRRHALPEEIAPAVVFLAGDASSFVTGEVLTIDGGYTAV